MTALSKYERLEATGLWRVSPLDQKREVIVSIGDATLIIRDINDQAITHWSLAAIERKGSFNTPAVFYPDGDPDETLEMKSDETEMIAAIDTLRRAVLKARPRPGRLRFLGLAVSVASVVGALVFWLPDALQKHTLSVVPDVTRAKIGESLLRRIERVAGRPCESRVADPALKILSHRTGAKGLAILRSGVRDSLILPGGMVLLNKALVEDYEEPDVAAGYILAEMQRAADHDSLGALLEHAGVRASFSLLTTGNLPAIALDNYAEAVLVQPRPAVDEQALLAAFETAQLRSTPYALALDVTGEQTVGLIEADPVRREGSQPLLRDSDWLRLQAICGG